MTVSQALYFVSLAWLCPSTDDRQQSWASTVVKMTFWTRMARDTRLRCPNSKRPSAQETGGPIWLPNKSIRATSCRFVYHHFPGPWHQNNISSPCSAETRVLLVDTGDLRRDEGASISEIWCRNPLTPDLYVDAKFSILSATSTSVTSRGARTCSTLSLL